MNIETTATKNRVHAQSDAALILICKTNIRHKRDIKKLTALLHSTPFIIKWNIDTKDVDNVLRIHTTPAHGAEAINLIKQSGYFCEELPD